MTASSASLTAWGDHLFETEQKKRELRQRHSFLLVRPRGRETTLPEVLAEEMPGRQRLINWQRCKQRVLQRLKEKHSPPLILSNEQIRNVDAIRNTIIPQMYGSAERMYEDDDFITGITGTRRRSDAIAIGASRRSGKTLSTAVAAAIIALSQPNGNVLVYNLTGRQAKEWLRQFEKVLDVMRDDPEFGWTLESKNANEFIHIRSTKTKTINTIFAYAGATQSNHSMIACITGECTATSAE